jgi:hypothetical protein
MKTCKGCKRILAVSEFYYNKTKKRFFSECKNCNKLRAAAWNKKNPERYKETCRRHKEKNPKKYTEYKAKEYQKNKVRYDKSNLAYRQSKHGKSVRLACGRLRELSKIKATPTWLTKEMRDLMKAFYANRPEGYHVDHIVPIKGKNVCGLHVPWNLQYLPAQENLKKRNKF